MSRLIVKKKSKKLIKKENSKKGLSKKDEISNGVKRIKIRVLGIGGGGSNIVSEIASRIGTSQKVSFLAANTDLQALKRSFRYVLRFQFGESFTHGLGTGMNQELAEQAAINEKERIKKLFTGYDFCIIVSSLGGGVGSGATPVFAKIAKNSGPITLGIFTLPFKFEGEKKQEIARESLQKLKPYLNAISVLPNDRIFQTISSGNNQGIEKNTPLKEALSVINKELAESLQGLIETIYLPGLINIDFADLKTILQGYNKFSYLNTVEVQGANSATEAIKKVLNCPFYPYTIRGAKRILFNITGDKVLSLSDISQISKMIFELANSEAKIIFGISQNKKYRDKIKIMLLATGCAAKIFSSITSVSKSKTKGFDKIKKIKRRKKELPEKTLIQQKKGERTVRSKPNSVSRDKVFNGAKLKRVKILVKSKEKEVMTEEKKEKESESLYSPIEKDKKAGSQNLFLEPAASPVRKAGDLDLVRDLSLNRVKIRKNALQLKKEVEEAEKEFLEKEKIWETPAFLRRQRKI